MEIQFERQSPSRRVGLSSPALQTLNGDLTFIMKKYLNKEWLEQKYVAEKMSINDIVVKFGYSIGTIHRHLRKHGIRIRTRSEAGIQAGKTGEENSRWSGGVASDPEWLRRKYWVEKMTVREMALASGCNEHTIYRHMKHYGVPLGVPPQHMRGELSHNWKGGRKISYHGYVEIYTPDHPSSHMRYMKEHRLVMEEHLGRILEPNEIVHHVNGIKTDNRIENLRLSTFREHSKKHITEKYGKAKTLDEILPIIDSMISMLDEVLDET